VRIFLALFAIAIPFAIVAAPAHADDLEVARKQSVQSGKPLMIVFR
jgi:hypothetical protein